MVEQPTYGDMTLQRAIALDGQMDEETRALLRALDDRVNDVRVEHQRFVEVCERMDRLYYAESFTDWGADLWADDPNVGVPGRSHVSVNTPAAYVDVPAALQAVPPVENMLDRKSVV